MISKIEFTLEVDLVEVMVEAKEVDYLQLKDRIRQYEYNNKGNQ